MPPKYSKCVVLLLLLIGIVFVQCDDGLPDDPFADIPSSLDVDGTTGYSNIDVSTARNNFLNFPFERISDQEAKGIRFVREEEKVAVDFYTAMNALFSSADLKKVAQSEQTHFIASGFSIDKYNLTDPTEGMTAGMFASQSLQAHYNQSIAEGSPSLMAAYITGAKLQESNLITIQNQLDRVANNRDLRNIYDALHIATRNHLRIMIKGVNANGGSYSPLFIDAEVFQDIVGSGFELGS